MNTTENIEFVNEVNKEVAHDVLDVLVSSLIFDSTTNTKEDMEGMSVFISFLNRALEQVIQTDVVKSKQDRLKVIKFMDQLKQQQNAFEIARGNKTNLRIAAERLGRKAQSAFSTPHNVK